MAVWALSVMSWCVFNNVYITSCLSGMNEHFTIYILKYVGAKYTWCLCQYIPRNVLIGVVYVLIVAAVC